MAATRARPPMAATRRVSSPDRRRNTAAEPKPLAHPIGRFLLRDLVDLASSPTLRRGRRHFSSQQGAGVVTRRWDRRAPRVAPGRKPESDRGHRPPLAAVGLLASCADQPEMGIADQTNATRRALGRSWLWVDPVLNTKAKAQAQGNRRPAPVFTRISRRTRRLAGVSWARTRQRPGSERDLPGVLAAPDHYANIADGRYTKIGVGVVRGADGSYYAIQEFRA